MAHRHNPKSALVAGAIGSLLALLLVTAGLGLIISGAVNLLWNLSIASIFGAPVIDFGQAVALTSLLFVVAVIFRVTSS